MSSRSSARKAGSTSWTEQDSKNEIVKMLFAIETDEHVLKDFSCAYQGTILLHGRLYILQRTLCFYSNIFGHETRKIVPMKSITGISKRNTLGIIPTAIEITVAGADKVVFASFFGSSSRNECYDLVSKLHMETGLIESQSRQSIDSDSMLSEYSTTSSSNSYSDGGNFASSSRRHGRERTLSEPTVKLPKPSSQQGHDRGKLRDRNLSGSSRVDLGESGSPSSLTSRKNESARNTNVSSNSRRSSPVTESPSSLGLAASPVEDASKSPSRPLSPGVVDAGPVDVNKLAVETHTELCRFTLPVGVRELYDKLFSSKSDSDAFLRRYHQERGDSEFQITQWKNTELGSSREISIRAPVTGAPMLAPDSTRVFKTQRKKWISGSTPHEVLILDTSQSMSDIPYGDYFTIEERWLVGPQIESQSVKSEVIVSCEAKFHKSTMFKGTITSRAKQDIKEACELWRKMASEYLLASKSSNGKQNHRSESQSKRRVNRKPRRKKRSGGVESMPAANPSDGDGSVSNRSCFGKCNFGTLNACIVYIWGIVVLAVMCYICIEVSETRRLLRLIVEKDEDLARLRFSEGGSLNSFRDAASQTFSKIVGDSYQTELGVAEVRSGLDEL